MTSFEELASLAQVRPRTPCGKQSFGLSSARDAARVRNTLTGNGWFVHPCYHGCGKEIFHLTTREPDTKKNIKLNRGVKKTRYAPGKRTRKTGRWKRNREMQQVIAIGTWEGEGGALHPSELED